MSAHSITEPSQRSKWVAGILVILYALVTMIPLAWIMLTGFKSPADAISYPPKVVFEPTLEGYVNLFTTRTRQTQEFLANNPPETWADEIVRQYDMVIVGPSKFGERFTNSVIIGFGSTFLSVFLGTLAAYAFSRFKIPLADDLLVPGLGRPDLARLQGLRGDEVDVSFQRRLGEHLGRIGDRIL